MALAPSPDQRWFQSRLSRPNANLTVLAGTDFVNRIVAVFETAEEAKEAVDAHNARLDANGPAEVSTTSPGHGPNNPHEENAVNKQQHTRTPVAPATTTVADRLADTLALVQEGSFADATPEERHKIIADLVEAMSDDDVRAIGAKVDELDARKGSALFFTDVDPTALAGMDLAQLSSLYDACRTLMNVAIGLACQPRFKIGRTGNSNPAGKELERFHDLAGECANAVAWATMDRKPANSDEALIRGWVIARYNADMADDFDDFAIEVGGINGKIAAMMVAEDRHGAGSTSQESAR